MLARLVICQEPGPISFLQCQGETREQYQFCREVSVLFLTVAETLLPLGHVLGRQEVQISLHRQNVLLACTKVQHQDNGNVIFQTWSTRAITVSQKRVARSIAEDFLWVMYQLRSVVVASSKDIV